MTSDSFTDAAGNVFLHGQEEPLLRAVGFIHRHPCPHYVVATVNLDKPYGCDCGGTALMGWRDWWPFPDEPHDSLVIAADNDAGADPSGDVPPSTPQEPA